MPAVETYPDGLLYHVEHMWLRQDAAEAVCGVTWLVQAVCGDVASVEPPSPGVSVASGRPCGEIESLKVVYDVIAPASGLVLGVNDAVVRAPSLINDDPYGEGWIIRVRLTQPAELDSLLDADAYRSHLAHG